MYFIYNNTLRIYNTQLINYVQIQFFSQLRLSWAAEKTAVSRSLSWVHQQFQLPQKPGWFLEFCQSLLHNGHLEMLVLISVREFASAAQGEVKSVSGMREGRRKGGKKVGKDVITCKLMSGSLPFVYQGRCSSSWYASFTSIKTINNILQVKLPSQLI